MVVQSRRLWRPPAMSGGMAALLTNALGFPTQCLMPIRRLYAVRSIALLGGAHFIYAQIAGPNTIPSIARAMTTDANTVRREAFLGR